jgi:hypothetical protein
MAISIADPIRRELRLTDRLEVTFLLLDGLRRPGAEKPSDVALCALGLDREGNPRPLALRVVAHEGEQAWLGLLRSLKAMGIGRDLLLVCCDGHPALLRALQRTYPGTPVQISIAHRLLSLARQVDQEWRSSCLAEARGIFAALNRDEAVARFRVWRTRWMRDGYRAVNSLESDLASCLTYYRFPQAIWPRIRTVNMLERVFRQARQAVFVVEPAEDEGLSISEPEAAVPCTPSTSVSPGASPARGLPRFARDAASSAPLPPPSRAEHDERPVAPLLSGDASSNAAARSILNNLPALPAIAGACGRAGTTERATDPPPPSASGQADLPGAHVRDLTADADFMWWLRQSRQRSAGAAAQIALACLAVLAGLVLGGVLMRLL